MTPALAGVKFSLQHGTHGAGWTLRPPAGSQAQTHPSGAKLKRIQLPAKMPVGPLAIQRAVLNSTIAEERSLPS